MSLLQNVCNLIATSYTKETDNIVKGIMEIDKYISWTSEMIKKEANLESIFIELRKQKIPPNFAAIIIHKSMSIDMEDAIKMVYNSSSYNEFGKISDLFLDKLTNEENEEQ